MFKKVILFCSMLLLFYISDMSAVLGVTSYKVTDYSNDITFLGNEVK